jgi:hypothetical protein
VVFLSAVMMMVVLMIAAGRYSRNAIKWLMVHLLISFRSRLGISNVSHG